MLVSPGSLSPVELLSRSQRVQATWRGCMLQWRFQPNLLYDIYLSGAPPKFCTLNSTPEQNFIRMMRYYEGEYATQHPNDPPPINWQMTDSEYGEVFEHVLQFIRELSVKGRHAWRKHKAAGEKWEN